MNINRIKIVQIFQYFHQKYIKYKIFLHKQYKQRSNLQQIQKMKQKRFYFIPKKDLINKSKPISKANNILHKLYKDNFTISYKFKDRKMKVNQQHSLQNVRIKLYDIYQTCRTFQLSRSIFLLAINIFKKYSEMTKNITITATQTLACLTLSIKFEQNKHYKLGSIVKRSNINPCELIGAQIYILQTIQFKLPLIKIQQYRQVLQQFKTIWNNYIHQNIKDLPENYEVDYNDDHNKPPFQNFANILLLSDLICVVLLPNSPTLQIRDFHQYLILAAYFVIDRSASLIQHEIKIKSLVSNFYKKNYKKQKVIQKEQSKNQDQSEPEITSIDKEPTVQNRTEQISTKINCEQYLSKISTSDYLSYKIKIQNKGLKKLHEIIL